MKLYKSNNRKYLYVMVYNNNKIYFGNPHELNVNNSNDNRRTIYIKDDIIREELVADYYCSCNHEDLKYFNTLTSLEFYLLFNKKNLKQSVLDYQKRFGVHVKIIRQFYNDPDLG
jgi:hypothetical protein